ncbi:hypothetical protein L208DRAFT_1257586, partial [Tricholoma matsutake]
FTEVLYFFLAAKYNAQCTLVAVKMFADADPDVFKESYGMLHLCKYLGANYI